MSDFKDVVGKIVGDLEKMKPPDGAAQTKPMESVANDVSSTAGTLAIRPLAIPNDVRRMHNEMFGDYKIHRKNLEPVVYEGKEMLRYKTAGTSYYLPKEIVDKKIPSLKSMEQSYKVNLLMAFEQGSSKISFTLGDKAKWLGYPEERIKKSGAFFEQIDRTEKAKAGMVVHTKFTNRDGKVEEIIGTLQWLRKIGKEYRVVINTDFTPGMNFETGEIQTPFTEDPVQLMLNRTMPRYEKNLRIALHGLIGLKKVVVFGETILDWTKISKRDAGRKDVREKTYKLATKLLKEMGFELVSIIGKDESKDFRRWQFIYKPPTHKKAGPAEFTAMDEEVKNFIDNFVEWQARSSHYGKDGKGSAKLTEKKICEYIVNTIKGHGFEVVKQIFNAVQRTGEPSPKHFWSEITKLKAKAAVNNTTTNTDK